MNTRVQLVCAYLGYPFIGLFLIGFWFIAGMVPPPDPAAGPEAVAQMFRDNAIWIRIGMLVATAGAVLTLPWQAVVAVQMRRIEGASSPLTITFVMAGALFCLEFVYPLMFFMVAAFRPDGDPEIIQRLHDLAWIALLGVVGTAIVQFFALGFVIMRDGRERPVYPRWFGYATFWAAFVFAPAGLIIFFKSGPFAWNGFIAWWVVLSVFGLYVLLLTAMTAKAVQAQAVDPDPDPVAELRTDVAALRAELAELRRSRV